MKILFCTPAPLTKSLGAAKVVVELAEEMRELGWECDLVSIKDLAEASGQSMSESLRRYLLTHAIKYDVVDYDHDYLPYNRSEFSQKTFFVARSVLLTQHLEMISIPKPVGIKASLGAMIKGSARRQKLNDIVCRAQATAENADLVNVSNEDDKGELIRRGISTDKIVVIPYGISRSRRPLFDAISSQSPLKPMVAFVGTFDYRKGAREFPRIVETISEHIPDVRFRLLGVKGMFQTEQEILSHFPKRAKQSIEVVLKYKPEELPKLLAPCSVGIFPSYLEGMPFGVLEMMAASLPVIAYDTPGPSMMLSAEHLLPRGDWRSLSDKVIELLRDSDKLSASRLWAKQQSLKFGWENAAQMTNNIYSETLERLAKCVS